MGRRCALMVNDAGRAELERLSRSGLRAEADRARAVLWSLAGESSAVIGQRLGVRAEQVRRWRGAVARGGVAALRSRPRPGRTPHKREAALAVTREVLSSPAAEGPLWTLTRLAREIEVRSGETISPGHLSVVLRKGARAHRRLVGTAIPGMAEEASGIVPGDGSQGRAEGGVDAFDGAGRGFAQQAFDLGPGRLDRVQIRRVAGQIEVGEVRLVEQGTYGLGLVGAEIVHDQDRIGSGAAQLGQEHLLQPGAEHRAVGGSRDAHGGNDPLRPKRPQDGDAFPMTARCRTGGTLTAGAPGMRADEVGAGSALIDEHKAFHGDARDRLRPEAALLLDRGPVLLARTQGPLFFVSAPDA